MKYVGFFVVVCLVSAIVAVCDRYRGVKFNDQFPPIDDDEFVRRCGPGVRRDVAIRIRRIVSSQLGIEYERVYPEQSFVKDLGCD